MKGRENKISTILLLYLTMDTASCLVTQKKNDFKFDLGHPGMRKKERERERERERKRATRHDSQ
jgi:hypothetical protein